MTAADAPVHPSGQVKVLYIAGYQRSGSSVLANILGEQPGWISLGEMRVYWRVRDLPQWHCGCGDPITVCPFWTRVSDRVERERFGWTKDQVAQLSHLTRTRHLPGSWRRNGLDRLGARLGPFQSANDLLYRILAEESQSRVLVDSSKALLYGQLLDRLPSVDLYVLHLIRDPRGVAHSLARRTARRRLDPRRGTLGLAMLVEWSALNRLTETWGLQMGRRYLRLRYEDFIEAPQHHLNQVRALVGEVPADQGLVQDREIVLGTHHTVAGGPHRHDRGRIQLATDTAWTTGGTVRRRMIELAGGRALRHYGYEAPRQWLRGFISKALHVVGTVANRISSSVLKLILNIMIGRMVGPSGAGSYYLFESWLKVLTTAGGLGLPAIVLRTVSVLEGNKERSAADRHLRRSLYMAFIATGGILALMLVASPVMGPSLLGQTGANDLLVLASLGSIFAVATQLIARAINGRGRPNLALALENSAVPGGLVLVLSAAVLLGTGLKLQTLLTGYVGMAIAAAGISYLVWRKGLTRAGPQEPTGSRYPFHSREMATFWILGLVGALTANLPFLILPQLFGSAEIGLFGISFRFVTMADTVNIALMAVFAPRFARHFAQGDRRALRWDLRESQVYGLMAYMPFVIAYFTVPGAVLSMVGPAFTQAAGILKIMTVGQIVNAATGPSAILLQMTKEESSLLRINLPCLVLLAVSVGGLGWMYGLVGAAWGYSLTVGIRNLAVYARARVALRVPASEDGL